MAKSEMSKKQRKELLIELIREGGYNSQEALIIGIKNRKGIVVPQATISRDLKELNIKLKDEEGNYLLGESYERKLREEEFADFFRKYAMSVTENVQLIGVQVQPGYSHPLAMEVKKMDWRGVVGTLCSEDLLLIAIEKDSVETKDSDTENGEEDAKAISEYLTSLLSQ